MMNSYYNRDLAFKYIREVIDDGLQKMGNMTLSPEVCNAWIEYSKKVLELTTQDYNPSILLNYLRIINNILPKTSITPQNKLSMCLEYLIGILKLL
ncbi:hypothetical protein QUW50_13185 [Barnesiella viscericola]|uniref:hypothetical protein n=1 Tax=Barnesiella viscericola TaxID=397865 RepID=UPI0025A39179|nr:hypothetical protein [Barnesiella viscericola]MDM8269979.1 hypothetical protein [Barnesiella viscericola]